MKKKELLKKFREFELSNLETKKIRGGDRIICENCNGNNQICSAGESCIVDPCTGQGEPPNGLICG